MFGIRRAMAWANDVIRMSGVCESWSLDELVQMTDQDMDGLLKHYSSGKVPTVQEVRN